MVWHEDLGMDEVGENSYRMAIIDEKGNTVAYAVGETPDECEERAKIIVNGTHALEAFNKLAQ